MSLPFSIRRARPADVFDVHRVHTTAVREGGAGQYAPEVLEAWVDAFNPYSFPRNIERMEFYVAEMSDRRVAGYLAFDLTTSEIESLYVAPWGKGLGLGSFLLGFAEESARLSGLGRVWLDSSINAVGFYLEHGWLEKQRHTRVRKGVEIPVVKMEKVLEP